MYNCISTTRWNELNLLHTGNRIPCSFRIQVTPSAIEGMSTQLKHIYCLLNVFDFIAMPSTLHHINVCCRSTTSWYVAMYWVENGFCCERWWAVCVLQTELVDSASQTRHMNTEHATTWCGNICCGDWQEFSPRILPELSLIQMCCTEIRGELCLKTSIFKKKLMYPKKLFAFILIFLTEIYFKKENYLCYQTHTEYKSA